MVNTIQRAEGALRKVLTTVALFAAVSLAHGQASGFNFSLGYGDWIRVLRANDFEIENLVELWPAEGATAVDFPYATNEWACQWPSEEVWIARKRG